MSARSAPPPAAKASELGTRIASALALGAVAIGLTWMADAGPFWSRAYGLFWLAASGAIAFEWQRMVGGARPFVRSLAAGLGLAVAASRLPAHPADALAAVALAAAVVGPLAGRARAGWAAAGVLYAASPLVATLLLRFDWPYGFVAAFWLFAVVWATDTMAYFGGRLIGGPKLWPAVSPKKTWAGFLVGAASGAAASALFAPEPSRWRLDLALGLAASVASQGGDLYESAIKRRFGVKDSGALIPGHGGVMDRLDGYLAAAAMIALVGVARAGAGHAAAGWFQW
ncbi:MAG: phosphatidate cytidylyltransferase [Hyphomicrobiales bacterium]|nr:phosphatidate cytidylyltransferase [Hyphomicrobiales bacterium]